MRTELLPTNATHHGADLQLSPVDIINGNFFINDGNIILGIYNPDILNALTVTIDVGGMVDGDLDVGDRTYTIPPISTWVIGRLPLEVYNQPNRQVWIDFSLGTALVAVVSFQ